MRIYHPKKLDWRKDPEADDIDDDAPTDPAVVAMLGFDPDDISDAEWDEVAREAKAEDRRASQRQRKTTESEKRMPNYTTSDGLRKTNNVAPPARRKHSAELSIYKLCLTKKPILVTGYGKSGETVCHLEINAAGLDLYGKNRKLLGKYTWEALVDKLSTP
jgi:hypothetical protein